MASRDDDKAQPKAKKRNQFAGDKVPHATDPQIEELTNPQEPLLNVFTFGWMEDGRLGYAADIDSYMQSTPRPIAALRTKVKSKASSSGNKETRFIVKSISGGYRHSLILLTNCRPEEEDDEEEELDAMGNNISRSRTVSGGTLPEIGSRTQASKAGGAASGDSGGFGFTKRKKFKLVLTGLNQRGLCEEPGFETPQRVEWDENEEPTVIAAGNGSSFVVTRHGNVYTWGHGSYGVLGHGDTTSSQVPRQIKSLLKVHVTRIACGGFHAIATSLEGLLYSWGRNDKGQCCRGFESKQELVPDKVIGLDYTKEVPVQLVCGHEHALCLVAMTMRDGTVKNIVYAWGDESRGQLGSGDAHTRFKPQENRWVSKLLIKYAFTAVQIACGGWHNLLLSSSGQVVSWGAGDYGQLGHGDMWDNPYPKVINDLKGVIALDGGARHSVAVVQKVGVLSWGYNGYGELGLGDVNVRTQPTVLTCFSRAAIRTINCGDRHTMVTTSHRAIAAKEDPALRPYFSVVEENVNKMVVKQIKKQMEKSGFEPSLLDDPDAPLPDQIGSADKALPVEQFEKGLRYCMDSLVDPSDWRRKSYEVCFEAKIKDLHLESICLACARFCLSSLRLVPKVRVRSKGNTKCFCKMSGMCVCYWSVIRSKFDLTADEDGCIVPNQISKLLRNLRAPAPIEVEDIEEALISLFDGASGDADSPKVKAVPFEKWYRVYYDEYDDDAKS